MTVVVRGVVPYQITYFILGTMQKQLMNLLLNYCRKVDGQSDMVIQRQFNDNSLMRIGV